jgi:Outer membrane cobalamin receptor protein
MRLKIISIFLVLAGCSATQPTGSKQVQSTNQVTPTTSNLSLADYLKRIAGVRVVENGTGVGNIQVLIRGVSTLNEEQEPLFIINGVNVGFGYDNAAPLVDVNDIASVQVLKSGQETAPYGMQGTNGVIVIRVKK